jgi:UDP-N-acetylmuramate: L-alanyl-gamma-D-glutamyl-meso-diaminopimelate ligase
MISSQYACSFDLAIFFSIKVPEPHFLVPLTEQLDVGAVVADLRRQGIAAEASTDVGELVRRVSSEAKPGDVVLVMSNGAFGGFIPSLISELEQRFGQ